MNQQLLRNLERDIRNQVTFHQMLKVRPWTRLVIHWLDNWAVYVLALIFAVICSLLFIPA